MLICTGAGQIFLSSEIQSPSFLGLEPSVARVGNQQIGGKKLICMPNNAAGGRVHPARRPRFFASSRDSANASSFSRAIYPRDKFL